MTRKKTRDEEGEEGSSQEDDLEISDDGDPAATTLTVWSRMKSWKKMTMPKNSAGKTKRAPSPRATTLMS